jgi:hypothetical protein
VLGYAHAHEALTGNIGNLALLKLAARLTSHGIVPDGRRQWWCARPLPSTDVRLLRLLVCQRGSVSRRGRRW